MTLRSKLGREYRRINRWLHPLSGDEILKALLALGRFSKKGVMVHSSLSVCGHILGGPRKVIEVLSTWVGGRDLVMPTHTYCYPEADGKIPQFNPCVTSSRVGVISDIFWRQPNVIRSLHPTHSIACLGPGAQTLCAEHELCRTPCGPDTPYEKMVAQEFSVLMFAVSMRFYTLFYTAEDAAQVGHLYEPVPYRLQVVSPIGKVLEVVMHRHDTSIIPRFAEMDSWLESRGLLLRQPLGLGELLFIPNAGAVHRELVNALRLEPLLLVAPESHELLAS